jgi:hypothetical protein
MTARVPPTDAVAPIDFSGVDLSSPLAAATSYVRIGLYPLKIPFRSKNPGKRGWQNLRLKEADLPAHFTGGPQNIGMILGEPSGLLDVDGDCPEAVVLMAELLPATDAVFGRAGKPASHWVYQSAGPCPKTMKLTDIDGRTTLIELRSTGAQTVFPPSAHEDTGEVIRFERKGVAAIVDPNELVRAVNEIGAGATLARRWNGARHETALGLAGLLLKGGWTLEETELFVGAVASAAGDEEIEDRLRAVRDTEQNLRAGKRVAGWTKFKETVGVEVASRVRRLLRISKTPSPGAGLARVGEYIATPGGIVREVEKGDGLQQTQLTNFTAEITGDVAEDDGAEQRRYLDLRCTLRGRTTEFRLPAASFGAMSWCVEQLGAGAIVEAGMGTRDRARAAIQHLSDPDIPRSTIYTHTGWRQIEGVGRVYLHGGGAVGPVGTVHRVETRLEGALASFRLPEPPTGEDLVTAIQASIAVLELAPDRIAVPLYASIWRAVLGGSDLGLFLVGPTGIFKSELAALLQQHFGEAMDRLHLPGSWSSTDNALEDVLFRAKDTLFTIDDFRPGGNSRDDAQLHSKAERVFRGTGNGAGRQRMHADTSLRPPRPPRAFPLATGEELPSGHSLRARIVVVEIERGDIDAARLSVCQSQARAGWYASVTAAFVQWVAGQYEQLHDRFRRRVLELRDELRGIHRRTPANAAELLAAAEIFLEFARAATNEGALTAAEEAELRARFRDAIIESATAQADAHEDADPVHQYNAMLSSAITSGRAHLAGLDGGQPANAERWGWEPSPAGTAPWRASGERVGWVDDEHIYLDPASAYRAAQDMCVQGQAIPVTEKRLRRLLSEKGLLARKDSRRSRLTYRVSVQGSRLEVLCLSATVLREPSQPAQPSPSRVVDAGVGHFVGHSDRAPDANRPSETAHNEIADGRGDDWASRAGSSGIEPAQVEVAP